MNDPDVVLAERALRLARVATLGTADSTTDVLVCRVGRGRYAVDLRELQAVHRPRGITRVPAAVPQIAGVLNLRGELVAVLNLATLVGDGDQVLGDNSMVLLVPAPRGSVGILVDEILGLQSLRPDHLDPPLPGETYNRGIADGRIALLDVPALLAQQRLGDAAGNV